jgi:hypothetical protein
MDRNDSAPRSSDSAAATSPVTKEIEQPDDLVYYAQAYLQIAKLSCQELLNSQHHYIDDGEDLRIPYGYQIVGPAIFNAKHGIECFLKALHAITRNEYQPTHDVPALFASVQKLAAARLKDAATTAEGDGITEEDIELLPARLGEVQKLIEFFSGNRILIAKGVRSDDLLDIQNEVFRYPRMRTGYTFDYEQFVGSLQQEDIEDLAVKIDALYEHLNQLGYLFDVDQSQRVP